MLVHSLLVESVDLRRFGGSAGGNDVLGDRFDRCPEAAGEKKLGPLSRKGACDSTADPTSGSVDHRNLVLEDHLWFLSGPGAHTRPTRHPSTPRSSEPSMMQTPRRRESGRPPPPNSPLGRCAMQG